MMNSLYLCMACMIIHTLFYSCATEVELIAHRGASFDAPENTLASAELAWERGADAVEVDVYLSKDGKIVVIHDDTTKRTGGSDRKVKDQTVEELKKLDVGLYKGEKWRGEGIPLLEEVLRTVPRKKRLFVEIKCGPEILPELKAVLRRAKRPPGQVVIIGFDLAVVEAAKKQLPELRVYWLSGMKKDKEKNTWTPAVEELLSKARRAGVDGLNVQGCEAVDRAFVGKVKAAGMGIYVWTVNDPVEARRLREAGVDGLTTDRPGWLREKMGEER